jgi:hypothetical protein
MGWFTPDQQTLADVKARERAQAARDLARAYLLTFGSPHGKTVLTDLEDMGCLRRTTMQAREAVDANATLVMEGRRQLVLHIHAMRAQAIEAPDDQAPARAETSLTKE